LELLLAKAELLCSLLDAYNTNAQFSRRSKCIARDTRRKSFILKSPEIIWLV